MDAGGEGRDAPSYVLVDFEGHIADRPNATTAKSRTRTGQPIEVTFWASPPPLPSHVCVHCPGAAPADLPMDPKVISAHDGLLFLRVVFDRIGSHGDYFVYHPHPLRPSLDLLPHPPPCITGEDKAAAIVRPHCIFGDNEVALLRRGGGYVLALLKGRIFEETEFTLHLYHSDPKPGRWTSQELAVEEPLRDTVVPIPLSKKKDNLDPPMYHRTSKVITVGGVGGTNGWVDLWRGILLCDVLSEKPVLRDMPLPPPVKGNWASYMRGCCPEYERDVTFSKCRGSIRYTEMTICKKKTAAKPSDSESYAEWVRRTSKRPVEIRTGWKVNIWSIKFPFASWEDWHLDATVDAASLPVDNPSHSEMLGILSSSGGGGGGSEVAKAGPTLGRVVPCYPTLSMDDDVVYFLANGNRRRRRKTGLVISVDVGNNALRGVAELDFRNNYFFRCFLRTFEISRYLNKTTVEDSSVDVSFATEGLQGLNLHNEELTTTKFANDNPAVIISDHLKVTNTDRVGLSFGSFESGAFFWSPPTKEHR